MKSIILQKYRVHRAHLVTLRTLHKCGLIISFMQLVLLFSCIIFVEFVKFALLRDVGMFYMLSRSACTTRVAR